MADVVFVDQHGQMRPLDNFFVLARNVKYVHIPKEVNPLMRIEICVCFKFVVKFLRN